MNLLLLLLGAMFFMIVWSQASRARHLPGGGVPPPPPPPDDASEREAIRLWLEQHTVAVPRAPRVEQPAAPSAAELNELAAPAEPAAAAHNAEESAAVFAAAHEAVPADSLPVEGTAPNSAAIAPHPLQPVSSRFAPPPAGVSGAIPAAAAGPAAVAPETPPVGPLETPSGPIILGQGFNYKPQLVVSKLGQAAEGDSNQ